MTESAVIFAAGFIIGLWLWVIVDVHRVKLALKKRQRPPSDLR